MTTACGGRTRVLNIVDDVTRECLAAIPDTSIRPARGAGTDGVDKAARQAGMIVSDNGTEFTSNAMLAWAQNNRRLAFHRARKAEAERLLRELQRRMRDELLNESLFLASTMPDQDPNWSTIQQRRPRSASAISRPPPRRRSLRNTRSSAHPDHSADRMLLRQRQRRKS